MPVASTCSCEARPLLDGLHHRLQPAVVGAVDQHHADFSFASISQSVPPPARCPRSPARVSRRPTTSVKPRRRNARARFLQRQVGSVATRGPPADRGRPPRSCRTSSCSSAISPAICSLSSGWASARSMKRTPSTSCASSAVVTEALHVGAKALARQDDVHFQQVRAQRRRGQRSVDRARVVRQPDRAAVALAQLGRARSARLSRAGKDRRSCIARPRPARRRAEPWPRRRSSSSHDDMPLERSTGRPVAAIRSSIGRLVTSPEPTFQAGTPTRSSSSTASHGERSRQKNQSRLSGVVGQSLPLRLR